MLIIRVLNLISVQSWTYLDFLLVDDADIAFVSLVLFRFYEVGFLLLRFTFATSPAFASRRKMPDDAAIAYFPEGGTMLLSWFFVITTTPITWSF